MRIFVSYSHDDDQEAVKEVVKILRDGGHEPWFDEYIIPGENWRDKLLKQIAQCDMLLALITPQFLDSEWCNKELQIALDQRKKILPVLLESVYELPSQIGDIQWLDLIGGINSAQAERLLNSVVWINEKQGFEAVVDDVFTPHDLNTYTTLRDNPQTVLDLWEAINKADACVFDLTNPTPDLWIELGIAIALSKIIVLASASGTTTPSFANEYNHISYKDWDDLRTKLEQYILIQNPAKKAAIRSYCHFCDNLYCRAVSNNDSANVYYVIADGRILWRLLLGQMVSLIVENHNSFPTYSSDVRKQICDMRSAVRNARFFICHLGYTSEPENLVSVGLSIGYAKPWWLIGDMVNIPSVLRRSNIMEDRGAEHFVDHQSPAFINFLKQVFPSLDNSAAIQLTTAATDWQQLQNHTDSGTSQVESDPIIGEIEILRYKGNQIEATHYLHPTRRSLVFGRAVDKGAVPLSSNFASGMHFKIFKHNDKYYVEDMDSRNGTFLDGVRLRPETPTEIFFKSTITAAGSHFLIWDERPKQMVAQILSQTQDLGGTMLKIDIEDIEPPPSLKTLHHEIILTAVYSMGLNTGRVTFEIQAYYPLKEVLRVLVNGLDLPDMHYDLRSGSEDLNLDNSPLELGIKPGTTLTIVPDRMEFTFNQVVKLIQYCERDLAVEYSLEDGSEVVMYEEEYNYIEYGELFEALYKKAHGTDMPKNAQIKIAKCPKCGSPIRPNTIVATLKPGKTRTLSIG